MKIFVNPRLVIGGVAAALMLASIVVIQPNVLADGPSSTSYSGRAGSDNLLTQLVASRAGSNSFAAQLIRFFTLSNNNQVMSSPSGCKQKANSPHHSHHKPGRVNTEVRATCNNPVPEMYHTSQLWNWRSWGWDRIGDIGQFSGLNEKRGSAFGNDVCEINLYRGTGDGWIIDVDGEIYEAETISNTEYDPCKLDD